jgi:hypothetical protein
MRTSDLVREASAQVSIRDLANRLGLDVVDEGRFAKAICLFHRDTRPSMFLYERDGDSPPHFHCYACGEHGDIFDLVKQSQGLEFKKAVDWLATAYRLDKTGSTSRRPPQEATPNGFELALAAYEAESDQGKLTDFLAARSVPLGISRSSRIALSVPGALKRRIAAEPDSGRRRELVAALDDAKLLRRRPQRTGTPERTSFLDLEAGYQDFFTDERIILPLHSSDGVLVGFAGRRTLENDLLRPDSPKYLYTPGLERGRLLYRLHKVLEGAGAARTTDVDLFLCEGSFDALRLESAGLYAVALLGSDISEPQVRLLQLLASRLRPPASLRVWVFLDRDDAGHRGAARVLGKLLAARIDAGFIFPTRVQLQSVGVDADAKDPDEIGRGLAAGIYETLLHDAQHPPALAVFAAALGDARVDDLLDREQWAKISPSRRYRAGIEVLKRFSNFAKTPEELKALLLTIPGRETPSDAPAVMSLLDFAAGERNTREGVESFLDDVDARLNHARVLAYAGSRRGELPADEPSWERIDIAATAFNRLIEDRFRLQIRSPLFPFDAVYVSRGFGKADRRLKTMPAPEELIVQQYLINEVLSERVDQQLTPGQPFSHWIPAVRYYRNGEETRTSGLLEEGQLLPVPLSFAYQIDMDVVEGRHPPTDQGMFRPFIDCWNHFMAALREQTRSMPVVYALRLDVSRYYDRIRRYVLRDQLGAAFAKAFEASAEGGRIADLIHTAAGQDLSSVLVDWICDQSFGYKYMDPVDGTLLTSSPEVGIPQGPVLSAWLGTVALFPVDRAALKFMQQVNGDRVRVGYARYVDDVVLVADSPDILATLRMRVEEATAQLKLSIIPKAEPFPPMGSEEFSRQINSGRVLAGSIPAWEPPLIPLGDGESGWGLGAGTSQQERQTSLEILRDSNLYRVGCEKILESVGTSFQAVDLRPSEIPKGTRWIWYALAEVEAGRGDVWERYWLLWKRVTAGTPWALNPNAPWEDPVLFALEGLEKLIEASGHEQSGLTAAENLTKRERIRWLCSQVLSEDFFKGCYERSNSAWKDHGVSTLKRQFWRRFLLVAWKASRVARMRMPEWPLHLIPGPVRPSLFRDLLSVAQDGTGFSLAALDQQSPYPQMTASESESVLMQPFQWLHHAIAALRADGDADGDPLDRLGGPLSQIAKALHSYAGAYRRSLPFLTALRADGSRTDDGPVDPQSRALALLTIAAVARKDVLLSILSRRPHLIDREAELATVLPPLPGIQQSALIFCRIAAKDDPLLERISHLTLPSEQFPQPIIERSFWVAAPTLEAGKQSDILKYLPPWSSDTVPEPLALVFADWPVSDALRVSNDHFASSGFSPSLLHRLGRMFDTLARINFEQQKRESSYEYVSASPYVFIGANERLALICVPVEVAKVANRAFLRHATSGLRSVEVPMEDAPIWRIGVTLTDLVGLGDDLIRYEAHDSDVPLEEDALGDPARFVLRSQLKKLRGAFVSSARSPRSRNRPHLPSTVSRALQLLEEYPTDMSVDGGISYVLATDVETAAMRLRYEERQDVALAGAFTHFISRAALLCIGRLPVAIAERMPPPISSLLPDPLSRTSKALLMLSSRIEQLSQPSETVAECLRILRAGIAVHAVSSSLRMLALGLLRHGGFQLPPRVDSSAEWGLGDGVTVYGRTSEVSLFAYLKDALGSKGSLKALNDVTPLGWLTVLGAQLGVIGERPAVTGDEALAQLTDDFRWLSSFLGLCASDESSQRTSLWPFEAFDSDRLDAFGHSFLQRAFAVVSSAARLCGLRMLDVVSPRWSYDPRSSRFVDGRGREWPLDAWAIEQLPSTERKTEETLLGDGSVGRRWTELVDSASGRLLMVNVVGRKLSALSRLTDPVEVRQSVGDKPPTEVSIQRASVSQAGEIHNSGPHLVEAQPQPQPAAERSASRGDTQAAAIPAAEQGSFDLLGMREKFQAIGWQSRSERVPSHVRIAILQFRIDDSYRHPLVEVGLPVDMVDRGELERIEEAVHAECPELSQACHAAKSSNGEHKWTNHGLFPSWAEFRRRRILSEVLQACERLNVDLLVLPEYSVRPETIVWLRTKLAKGKTAVLAGSYRVFDDTKDTPRLSARMELLYPLPANAILDLLRQRRGDDDASVPEELLRGPVMSFAREKKYRSIAMEEFIRPSTAQLLPLFTLRELNATLARQGLQLSHQALLDLATSRLPLRNCTELICSELFLLTSPANYHALATDYRRLNRKFGIAKDDNDLRIVLDDLQALAACLGAEGPPISEQYELPRRGLVLVPAATSRTADYWICGQSALLAAGLTTVFCNAVGVLAAGGSCFIGRNSWKLESDSSGMIAHTTPYHGWSKGIYYSRALDALSSGDQALVVADVDPAFMSEGKPRPQMLHLPLQLVAYLPMVELAHGDQLKTDMPKLMGSAFKGFSSFDVGSENLKKLGIHDVRTFQRALSALMDGVSARKPLLDENWGKLIGDFARFFSSPADVQQRLEMFIRNAVQQPSGPAWESAALYDWIAVDLNLHGEEYPSINVGPWSDKIDPRR